VELLKAQADVQRFQVEATYLTLTSNLVAAAIQEAALRDQVAANEQIITLQRQAIDLVHRQRAIGQAAQSDVTAQEAALAQTETALPPLNKQLAQQRDLLTALMGGLPSEEPYETFTLAALHLPETLPVSLPGKLVEQRPDIRAAEASLHSASAQIGVAMANRLPNITLTGALGGNGTTIANMFTGGNLGWELAGDITAPIFHGNALLHQERAARAAYDQASAQYRSVVVSSFQNVADTLHALAFDADSLNSAARAEVVAATNLEIVRRRAQMGAANTLALLNAEQSYQQALINLVQARAGRYADTVALFQALGGGWWNRTDDAAPQIEARKP
jgi:NodT family efflux transporter outer membrane factor (OMF) lipoprotein